MKVLIAVGGGGHFSPALAVVERMPKNWEILLVGRKYAFEGDSALSFEYQTAKRLGLHFESLTTGRLQRKITKHSLMSLVKVPVGLTQSLQILRKFRPDVVVSFGGYISVPIVLTAAALRVPIVIHEQTLHAGLANKIASKFAAKICLSWSQSSKFFPKEKIVLTGNPLRKSFLGVTRDLGLGTSNFDNSLPLIYITGGSGGAHGINILIEGCLERLLEKFSIIHQTGDAQQYNDFERLEQIKSRRPATLQKRYELKKFVETERVMEILKKADLIVARSGINTVTELLYLGKPSLLIPLPYGQHNEQLANAKFVRDLGLAEILDQRETTPEVLFKKIDSMITGLATYRKHADAACKLIHPDAAEKIIKVVEGLIL